MRVCLSGGWTFGSSYFVVIPGRALRANPESRSDMRLLDSGFARARLRSPRNDGGCCSMIIPRDPDGAGDVVIAGGEFEAGAGGLLADIAAIEFLPGRLVFRIGEAAHRFQVGKAPLQLFIRNQDIGVALVEVDADTV